MVFNLTAKNISPIFKVLSFNDDIQGTGSVTLAGILTALRLQPEGKRLLKDNTVLFDGCGSAAIGCADALVAGMKEEGLTEEEAKKRIYFVDTKGLVTRTRGGEFQSHKGRYVREGDPAITGLEKIVELEIFS